MQAFEMTLPMVTDISYKDLVINMDVCRKSKTANREDDKLPTMIMIMGPYWELVVLPHLKVIWLGKHSLAGHRQKRWVGFASLTRAVENQTRWRGIIYTVFIQL